jgi:EAL domain-containing protein (putative c-di-GMP-specific phosphodiesterase class I)
MNLLHPADLHRAFLNGDLDLAYHAQWDLTASRADDARESVPVAVEALSRWSVPGVGEISPVDFVPLAEKGRFLDALDLDVLRRAAKQVVGWHAAHRPIQLSVNCSPAHFSVTYAEAAIGIIEDAGLDPAFVTVEITEAPSPQLGDSHRTALERLRSAGVFISVDDFGAGDITLDALRRLPVDEVKIDRSIMQRHNARTDTTISAVIASAAQEGWRVVAEGIETLADLQRAVQSGCDRGQGFLWGRPVSAATIETMIA